MLVNKLSKHPPLVAVVEYKGTRLQHDHLELVKHSIEIPNTQHDLLFKPLILSAVSEAWPEQSLWFLLEDLREGIYISFPVTPKTEHHMNLLVVVYEWYDVVGLRPLVSPWATSRKSLHKVELMEVSIDVADGPSSADNVRVLLFACFQTGPHLT